MWSKQFEPYISEEVCQFSSSTIRWVKPKPAPLLKHSGKNLVVWRVPHKFLVVNFWRWLPNFLDLAMGIYFPVGLGITSYQQTSHSLTKMLVWLCLTPFWPLLISSNAWIPTTSWSCCSWAIPQNNLNIFGLHGKNGKVYIQSMPSTVHIWASACL